MQRLLINRTGVNPATGKPILDMKGEHLIEGSFHLKNDHNHEKEILFRPIVAWPRYYSYNAKTGKYEGDTVYIRQLWNEETGKYVQDEPIDSNGGIMLGRPAPAVLNAMSEEEQEKWRNKVKWQICIFGVAYFPGKKEGVLVEFAASGRKGMDMLTFLNGFKKPWYQNLFILSLDRNGKHIQPQIRKLKTDLLKDMDEGLKGFLKACVDEVYAYGEKMNSHIRDAHEKAMIGKVKDKTKPDVDLDEEIPF